MLPSMRHRNGSFGGAAAAAVEPLGWRWTEPSSRPSRSAPPSRWKLKLAAAAVVAVAGLWVAGFFVFVQAIARTERPPGTRTDGIVALTGGAQRIGDAIDLLARGYADRLLITGVNERTSRDEIARLNPGQRRLFDCCVDLDYQARNTVGNAIQTRRWIADNGFRSVIVVTSNYHMPRTLLELEHALPGVRKVPYAVVAGSADLRDWWRSPGTARLLASEYMKFATMWLRTRVERDPERSRVLTLLARPHAMKVVAQPAAR